MKKLMTVLSPHKIMAVCVAVLMMVSLTFASISIAKSNAQETAATKTEKENCAWYQRRSYYSDATYTNQVGTRIWFCEGLVGGSGTVTPYYQEYFCECFEEGK